MNKPKSSDERPAKTAVEEQADVRKREAEQHQQPLPVEGDPVQVEYERPLPQPGDKDYVAGQPVDDAEADETESQLKQRMQDADRRRKEAEQLRDQQQRHPDQQQRGPHGQRK
jgi:hypothetical protein